MHRRGVCQALRDSRGGCFDIWRELPGSPSLASLFGTPLAPGRGEIPQWLCLWRLPFALRDLHWLHLFTALGGNGIKSWFCFVFLGGRQGIKGSYSDSFLMQWTWRKFLFSLSVLNGNVQMINEQQKEGVFVSRQALSNLPDWATP